LDVEDDTGAFRTSTSSSLSARASQGSQGCVFFAASALEAAPKATKVTGQPTPARDFQSGSRYSQLRVCESLLRIPKAKRRIRSFSAGVAAEFPAQPHTELPLSHSQSNIQLPASPTSLPRARKTPHPPPETSKRLRISAIFRRQGWSASISRGECTQRSGATDR
jgi:hypothetical protein